MSQVFELGSGGLRPLSPEGKNDLEPGRILWLNGYSEPEFIITKNCGVIEKREGWGAKYEAVNLDDFSERGFFAYELKWESEKKDNRIQVYIADEVRDADAVMDAVQNAKAATLVREAEEQKKKTAREEGLKMLPTIYPKLTPMAKLPKKSSAAVGAMNLKKELAEAFPGVKFSVSSEYFANGSAIRVNWTDGPSRDEVCKISDKYQEGDFDGMTDSYDYREEIFTDVFGGAKYVSESRSNSLEAYAAVAEELGYTGAVMNDKTGDMVGPGLNYEISQMIKQTTWKKSFLKKKEVL